jgi:hypothetical protein
VKVSSALLALCLVCYTQPPCSGDVCVHSDSWCRVVECGKGPSVGRHSHNTTYGIVYSPADLAWNKTRSDVRSWLEEVGL